MRLILLNRKGFNIPEALLVIAIIGFLMGSVFYLFSVAQSARSVSAAKMELQSEVRRTMDWIINDVRQTVNWSIGSAANDPLSTHIKFKKVIGYSTAGSGSAIFGDFIEYTYDSTAQTITRTDLGSGRSWTMRYISQVPFYTRLSTGEVIAIDPLTPGDDSPVFTTGNLVIIISGEKEVNSSLDVNYTLAEEVKIRN